MYKGQAIIYPSMYSLNILLYNKDYKTSNIHRWLSCVDSLPKVLITLAIMYTLRKGYQETVLSASLKAPQGLILSLLGGRNSFSSLCYWRDSHSHLTPLFCFFFWVLQTFFFSMSCVSCIFKSTKLFLQDNGNEVPGFLSEHCVCGHVDRATMLTCSNYSSCLNWSYSFI